MTNINVFDETKEEIIKMGPASLHVGREVVGGKLFLTKSELVFRPHALNIQKQVYRINVGEIKNYQLPFFPPTALIISDGSDNKEKFLVYKRKEWITLIKGAQDNN